MPTPWQEYSAYAAYCLVGPLMWVLAIIGMYQTQKRMSLVKQPRDPVPQPYPPVTILIPAKDEGGRIGDCLRSALAQDYPNFNVIAIDDRSADNTGAAMDELARQDSRLMALHITELPDGWTGKCNALHQGAQRANGQWLLCVDSDVVLDPDALSATLGLAIKKKYGLVSLLPRMESQTVWEEMLVPLAGAAVTALFTAAWTNTNHRPRTAFANGQYMLMRRDAYDSVGGHSAVRDQYCEDMALGRLFKRNELRPRVSWGTDLCSVRMYDSFSKIMRGWSRIFYAAATGSPWRSLLGIAFVLFCCYSVFPALAYGLYCSNRLIGDVWIGSAVLHWALMTVQIGIMYHWTLNPRRYALVFPITAILLMTIFAKSIWMCLTKRVEWRGTSYKHAIDRSVVTGG
jgi:chlorobactene glucosyltransferase